MSQDFGLRTATAENCAVQSREHRPADDGRIVAFERKRPAGARKATRDFIVPEHAHHFPRKVLRLVRDERMHTRHDIDALAADRGRHGRYAAREGVEDLHAHPAAGADRYDHYPAALEIGLDVRYMPGEGDPAGAAGDAAEAIAILADDRQMSIGDLRPDIWEHLLNEIADGIRVGRPVQAADEQNLRIRRDARQWCRAADVD